MAVDASLVGSGHSTTASFTTSAGAVSAGDTLIFCFAYDPGTTISSVSLTGSGSDTLTQIANLTAGTGRLAVYRKENATGGASVTATANFSGSPFPSGSLIKCTGAATASYDSASLATGTDGTSPYTITSGTFAQADNVVIACIEQNSGTSGAYASSNFTVLGSETDISNYWLHCIAKLVVSATTAVTPSFTRTNGTNTTSSLAVFGIKAAAGGGGGLIVNPLSGIGGTTAQPLVN